MNQTMTYDEQMIKMSSEIARYEANPVLELFGMELGTAKLVRDGRTFRIFIKEVQKAKSGKATLVEMKVFVTSEDKEFALVRGHTYLPNFVLDNKDVYWILQNKIHGKTSEADHLSIDSEYVPKEFKTFGNYWSSSNDETAEKHSTIHIEFLKRFKEVLTKDYKLEVGIPKFMEMVA
jgi:hypothetical protein